MTTGHWYANGRYLVDASVSGAFKWGAPNGGISATTYALYATVVNSASYTPDPRDMYLGTAGNAPGNAIPTAGEPTAAQCTTIRQPVYLEPIAKAHVTSPSADYVLYLADGTQFPTWTVNSGNTLTAGYILFYWDKNVANGDGGLTAGTAYYPSGGKNAHDTTCALIAYAPFVDASTGHNYWAYPATVACSYDTSIPPYSIIVKSQVN
jgi:hypothetical protein